MCCVRRRQNREPGACKGPLMLPSLDRQGASRPRSPRFPMSPVARRPGQTDPFEPFNMRSCCLRRAPDGPLVTSPVEGLDDSQVRMTRTSTGRPSDTRLSGNRQRPPAGGATRDQHPPSDGRDSSHSRDRSHSHQGDGGQKPTQIPPSSVAHDVAEDLVSGCAHRGRCVLIDVRSLTLSCSGEAPCLPFRRSCVSLVNGPLVNRPTSNPP